MRTYPGEILSDAETFEPKISSVHAPIDRLGFMHRTMARQLRRQRRVPLKHLHPRGIVVHRPGPHAHGAVVKSWQGSVKQTSAHLRYLTQEGKGGESLAAEFFTAEDRTVDRRAFIKAAKQDTTQHRLILSIPDHQHVDLRQLARAFMRHLETQALHAKVEWLGAVHRDVHHPHVHLVIRGTDVHGRPVHFTHDYRLRSMRYQVQALVTAELGEVSQPVDVQDLEGWVEAHMQETKAMQDDHSTMPEPTPVPTPTLMPPRIISQQEAQRRLEETRQRMQETIARLNARHHGAHRSRQVEPETLQHRPGEPEHSQAPDQQATPPRGMAR